MEESAPGVSVVYFRWNNYSLVKKLSRDIDESEETQTTIDSTIV